jgi:hypothetical protein
VAFDNTDLGFAVFVNRLVSILIIRILSEVRGQNICKHAMNEQNLLSSFGTCRLPAIFIPICFHISKWRRSCTLGCNL